MRQWQSADWGTYGRPRLLIEDPALAYDGVSFRAFRDAGFAVARCSGPDACGQCPRSDGEPCALADSADLIAYALDQHLDDGRRILRAHRKNDPETPVVVFTKGAAEVSVAATEGGVSTLPWPTSVHGQTQLFHAVLAAAGRNEPNLRFSVRGPVTSAERAYALRALGSFDQAKASIRILRVDLVRETDPDWERPALARAVLDVDGHLAWVHADATTMSEAITRLGERVCEWVAPFLHDADGGNNGRVYASSMRGSISSSK